MHTARKDWALSTAQKMDARAALDLISKHAPALTLERAVELALGGKRSVRQITVETAIDEFRRANHDWRESTAAWYDYRLASLRASLGDKQAADVTRSDLLAFVAAQSRGAQPGYARAARALFRWMRHSEPPLIVVDPSDGLLESTPKPSRTSIEFLTVEQSAAIIRADTPYRHAFLLGLFAGIRPEEIAGRGKPRLPWPKINRAERTIRIEVEHSKTGVARFIEQLPETLWLWLDAFPPVGNVVSMVSAAKAAARARTLAGMREWPHDAIRHTFATYAVALTGDTSRVSLWLGHEGNVRMLHRHYRGLATKAQAEAFFALRP